MLLLMVFVFIAGVSLVFSLSRTIGQFGRGEAVKRVFRRSALLFVIALIYSGGLTHPWPDIRLLGIGIAQVLVRKKDIHASGAG